MKLVKQPRKPALARLGFLMRAIVDTNVLIRLFVEDDFVQSRLAAEALRSAEATVISLQTLCEFVWVLGRNYKVPRADISSAIRKLLEARNVVLDRPAVEAALDIYDAGGDFADSIIDSEGRLLGGTTFLTFDKKAAELLNKKDRLARLLGGAN